MSLLVPSKTPRPSRVPGATYRLQLQPGFGFVEAMRVVPLLARLGITDCYVSPITAARPGSTHGYDVCDHTRLNPELGSDADFDTFVSTLRAHGMGLVVDIVPNHMAADESANPWWRDVLEHGRDSRFASHFDIDWAAEARGRLVLPVLEHPYGRELDDGKLRLTDGEHRVSVAYGDRRFPVAGEERVADQSADAVHEVLERQAYRLAWWRIADDEVNYRRFFAVNDLVALRMDDRLVFDDVHRLIGKLVRRGDVTGLRIDHPDGLADPEHYFASLQSLQQDTSRGTLYVVAEKILTAGEPTRDTWAIHGTTGYDFLRALNGLFLGSAEPRALERVQAWFTGTATRFRDVAHRSKLAVMETSLAGDIDRLALMLVELAQRDRKTRDFSRRSLRQALVHLVASLDVYRTYVTPRGVDAADRIRLQAALDRAATRLGPVHADALAFVGSMFLTPIGQRCQSAFVTRAQQVMAAVFAKAVEDRAFYRDATLVSMNEVGANRLQPNTPARRFHAFIRRRQATDPFGLSATSTHDTKLSEDARARLNAIAACVPEWRQLLGSWRAVNERHRVRLTTRTAPARADEYRFYQAVLALWPCHRDPLDASCLAPLADRVVDYLVKSAREAARSTSWIATDAEYEAAIATFVRRVLMPDTGAEFLSAFAPFARRISRAGVVNSLAQVVLKVAAPGVPDFYQGTERWALQLVDPDNRLLPDYPAAADMLDALDAQAPSPASARALLDRWEDGAVKMYVTMQALRHRRQHPALYADGRYLPTRTVSSSGPARVLAFARRHARKSVLVVAPYRGIAASGDAWPVGDFWNGAALRLPANLRGRRFLDLLTGRPIGPAAGDGQVPLADVLRDFPVAFCVSE
ncbi:MAG TPA: malto-oligosyltrehalose synthase [Vicinamibacterales bacterium]|nr:malto-oligosyltrehalose synthase [Vicinamibacterales bacterium]